MLSEISKKDMIKISTALLESRDMDAVLRDCLPLFMHLSQCSIIGLYCKGKQDMYHISVSPGIFLENSNKLCQEIMARLELEADASCVSTFYCNLNCYSFKLQDKWRLLVCLHRPFSPDFFHDFVQLVGLLGRVCIFHEDGSTAKVSTERLRSLEETEKIFLQLVEHVPSVFWVRDIQKIHYVSPGYEHVFGTSPESIYKDIETLYQKIHAKDRQEVVRRIQNNFFSREIQEIEFRIIRSGGEIRWISLKSYPVLENGEVMKRAGISEDITAQKTMFHELEKYRHSLHEMVEEKTCKLTCLNRILEQEVGERRNLQSKLIKSRAVFKSFMDSLMHPAFLVDFDGSILALNKPVARVFDSSPEIMVGSNAFSYLTWEWFEYFVNILHKVLCTKKPFRFEEKIINNYYDIQVSPVIESSGNAYQAVFYMNDISDLMQTKEELHESWLRLRYVVDSLPVLVHAHDEHGNYIFWNKASERILGYTSEEMIHNPEAFEILYPDEDMRREALACWADHDENGPCAIEVSEKSGKIKVIEWIRLSGKFPITGWKDWEIGIDVTDKKETEKKLVRAMNEAENANAIKSRFLANISHEVRTPLSGIIGLSNRLVSSLSEKIQKKDAQSIACLSEYLLHIINEILDFTKLENGKYNLERQNFCLEEVLDDLRTTLLSQSLEKDIKISVRRSSDIPDILYGDQYALRKVLVNLASNAVKFTDSGAVSVSTMLLESVDEKVVIQFMVSDSGIGVPLEMQEKIFEPFTQVEGGFSRRYGGTGLGLAICKSLVEMMSGNMWVESVPGEGTRFFVVVPFELPKQMLEKERLAGHRDVLSERKLKILLVEDFIINQEIIAHILYELGHEVALADNGKEALAALESGNSYDVVFMDLQMPDMDGFEATARIRAHADKSIAGVPVIALTAHTVSSNIDYAFKVGMNGYLIKPVKPEELKRVLQDVAAKIQNADSKR